MRSSLTRTPRRWTSLAAVVTAAALPGVIACDDDTPGRITSPATPSIGIRLASGTLSVAQGNTGTVVVTVSRDGGFTGAVTLAVTGLPLGITATLDPSVVPSGASNSTLTLTTVATMAPGSYPIVISGSGTGVVNQSAALTLTVILTPTPSITIGLGTASLLLDPGKSGSVSVTVSRDGGYTGAVALALTGLPVGVTATLDPPSVASGASGSTLTLTTVATTAPGSYTLTITASGQGVESRSVLLLLTITTPSGPSIVVQCIADDGTAWTVQGDTWTWEVNVMRFGGYTGPVSLTIEGLPPRVTASFDPASLDAGTTKSAVSFTAEATATPVITNIIIRARGVGVPDAATVVRFVVFPPA